ncbi:hypothetical protein FHG87_015922 [Trinorchestia longiramus]|nr:hypothetical protein FHG87_015922 [Trinorchestia longiramus]
MKELKKNRSIARADTVRFCGILNERMKHVVEEQIIMGEEQNGFRRDRRGEDNLFVDLQRMLEIVGGYSSDFKVKFGEDISKVMVINGDETDRDRE